MLNFLIIGFIKQLHFQESFFNYSKFDLVRHLNKVRRRSLVDEVFENHI